VTDRIQQTEMREEQDRAEAERLRDELMRLQERKRQRREQIRQILGAAIAEKHAPPEPEK
jgi:hypothetical protein